MTNAQNEHSSNKNKIILLKKKNSLIRLTFFIIKMKTFKCKRQLNTNIFFEQMQHNIHKIKNLLIILNFH
jgi:hypothetical protein